MSREIKFRVYHEGLGMSNEPIIGGGKPVLLNEAMNKNAVGEVMQYTGLKDKNGVEIYEGDICKTDYREGLLKIEYSQGAWSWQYYQDPEEFEVLGNIYENPELCT